VERREAVVADKDAAIQAAHAKRALELKRREDGVKAMETELEVRVWGECICVWRGGDLHCMTTLAEE
jgi:hypothetical protein